MVKGGFLRKAILIFGLLFLSLLVNCDNFKSKEMSQEKKLELAEKCSKAGREFYDQFRKNNFNPDYMWDEPEYHYNSRFNTCLIWVRYITFGTDNLPSYQYNEVIDIFSNKTILYGWFTRDTKNKDKEEVFDTGHPDVPNYTSERFFKEKSKLFSE